MEQSSHEIAKHIRHNFFVYRNGLLADTLKAAGDSHKLIFGLNLPQIMNIANNITPNKEVAMELWNSTETRECRLIAPMLFPLELFDEATAIKWISEVENVEIADNLCHKLLRKAPYASNLCEKFICGTDMERYTALRLAVNLLAIGEKVNNIAMLNFAKKEIQDQNTITLSMAKRLLEDLTETMEQ